MKFRCIYCSHAFEADALPPACPICATPFTLAVGPKTKLFELAQAVDKNGYELNTKLVPIRPEDAPLDFALAAGPEEPPREHTWATLNGMTFCRACTVVLRADGKNKPCRGRVGLSLREDTEPRPAGCACHIEAGDSLCPVHGDDEP